MIFTSLTGMLNKFYRVRNPEEAMKLMYSDKSFDYDAYKIKSSITLKTLLDSKAYKILMKKFPGYQTAVCIWNRPGFGINNEGYRTYAGEDNIKKFLDQEISSGSFYEEGSLFEDNNDIKGKIFSISAYNDPNGMKEIAQNLDCYCGMMGFQHRAKSNDEVKTYLMFLDSDKIIDISKNIPEEYAKCEKMFNISIFGKSISYIVCSHDQVPNGAWEHYACYK